MENTKQFLDMLSVAYKAQIEMIEEAWQAWESCPAQDAWEGGFKGYLVDFIEKDLKEKYVKAGIPQE